MEFYEEAGQVTENFKAEEFRCKGETCKCGKIYISKQLVEKLQELRDIIGKPINVNSGYRCPIHNEFVGSDSKSPHLLGKAADIRIEGVSSKEIAIVAEQIGFDGIAYINDKSIHLDLKGRKWYADERTGKTFKTFQPSGVPPEQEKKPETLRKGSKGDDVKKLQEALNAAFLIEIDGDFGAKTEEAVKMFQQMHGLEVDGVVGAKTKEALGIKEE